MSVNVKQLYDSVNKQDIELLAGSGGLNRVVRWVHMVENPEISAFLEGGEIAFTTGVATAGEKDLFETVKSVVANGGSGIVINIGPYVKKIGGEIIEFCEERQIPLFQVPWSVHMAEIMRQFCLMITLADKRQLEISSAVRNAILFPKQRELYVPHLENYGLRVNDPYRVMILKVEENNKENPEIYHKILIRQLDNCISQMEWKCTLLEMDGNILFLFAGTDYTEEKMEECRKTLHEFCTQLSRAKSTKVGIGEPTKNIYCIHKSFEQAKSVIDLAGTGMEQETVFYNHLGIYKLLFVIEDKEIMRKYVDDTIGKLLRYDELNDNNLTEVLRIYLKYNGSVRETSEELFVHRNTINYKIRKIGELLDCSLADYEVCSQLNVALKLHDIINVEVGHLN